MLADVRHALNIDQTSSIEDRTIDITTTGRHTGQPRRIEICFYRFEDDVYLSVVPGPRMRDWIVNLNDEPRFIFHLKHNVVIDLSATATVMTDRAVRKQIFTSFVDDFNSRNRPDSSRSTADPYECVQHSPQARVSFDERD